jgi:hypothetical protein
VSRRQVHVCVVNVAHRRDKTLSMRPMGEGLDVIFGGFGSYLPQKHSNVDRDGKYLVLSTVSLVVIL